MASSASEIDAVGEYFLEHQDLIPSFRINVARYRRYPKEILQLMARAHLTLFDRILDVLDAQGKCIPFGNAIYVLRSLLCLERQQCIGIPCAAGDSLFAYDPKGYAHGCIELMGLPQSVIGCSKEHPTLLDSLRHFRSCTVPLQAQTFPESCLECTWKHACGGGCWAARSRNNNHNPFCAYDKTLVEGLFWRCVKKPRLVARYVRMAYDMGF